MHTRLGSIGLIITYSYRRLKCLPCLSERASFLSLAWPYLFSHSFSNFPTQNPRIVSLLLSHVFCLTSFFALVPLSAHKRSFLNQGLLSRSASSLWARSTKNQDVSTGRLARSLAPLTRLLAPHCSLSSGTQLRSLVPSLAHLPNSLARGK